MRNLQHDDTFTYSYSRYAYMYIEFVTFESI